MGRRSDMNIVEEIISFLIEKKDERSITMRDFCNVMGINSATARKWLDIIHLINLACPNFYFEEEENMIKFPKQAIISIGGLRNHEENR